jgi:parallel beta-helix repeat protein
MKCFPILCLLLALTAPSYAAVIHVPADQPTIQAAINAAQNGDAVIVAPGTYFENINIAGKAITVKSANGNKVTIIDGGFASNVVTFDSGEGLGSVLQGFTIQHGFNRFADGGGILISSASPTITGNIVTNNTSFNNCQLAAAGISVLGAGSAQIIGNLIENNTATIGNGGGMQLWGAGTPTLKNNVIRGNVATGLFPYTQGGGIYVVNDSDALIVQNLIYNNTAGQGSGIFLSVPVGSVGPLLVNNTIVGTSSSLQGSAVYASGFDNQVQFFNNLMIGPGGANAVFCEPDAQTPPPTFTNNDAFSPNGSGLQGTCASQSGANGNISANPRFVGTTTFQLQAGSPVIDAGDNSAPDLPPLDLRGNPRIVDGDGDGLAIIDMGAYEYQPPAPESVTPAPPQ